MTANLCVKCAPLFNAAPCYLFVTCDACRQQCRAKGALTLHTHYAGSSAQPAWSVPQYHLITALPHQQSHPLSKPPTPAPRVPGPPVPPRIPPPTPVVLLPLVEADSPADPPKAIAYQSLRLLLIDLNRLLCTPHEEQPFDFRGTCSIVADPAVDHATRVTSVAWALIRGTAVSFNVHTLAVHCSPRAALAVTGSSAIWMGAPPDPRLANATQPRPCERCEHLLHIHVDADDSACARGLQGQRIVVRLWHYPT
ncbi:hypothetical protein B0H17DRAFT_376990 [Mycena rosella]|uniref:Uncharacterized protein n=1 Tax=Mycena rosella TaxID=1033263 RepID=A0AAD7DRA0_MYCRO|nr:hypothetical protein B0H17DRAFT_376990 [Mycena rosella]